MRRYRLALLLLLSLSLAACGGATQPAVAPTAAVIEPTTASTVAVQEPTQAPTVTVAEPTAEPTQASPQQPTSVKIGVLNPTTGSFTVFGKDVNAGIELYFNSIDNKVADTPIELVFADTAGDPQQALEQARRLVEQEKVDFLTGIVNSAVVVPLAQFADQQEVPLLILVGGALAATGPDRSPYVFRTAMANGQQDRPLGWYTASELGLKRAATFAWDFAAGEARSKAFAAAFTAAGGNIVTQQKPPVGTTDYGPFISQVDPTSIDVAYAYFAGPGAIAYVQQMRQFGLTPDLQIVSPGFLTEGEVLQSQGKDALGIISATHYTPVLDNPENKTFLEQYEAKFGGLPGTYVEAGYLGAVVVAAAIEAVGGDLSDKQPFLDALAELNLDTPAGPFRFDARGQAIRNIYITRVVEAGDGSVTHEVIDVIEDVSQDWSP
ncbi:MAG TPA: hypothetical protein DEP84_03150 [Chloroflexi bacterium]|nr:hypothetical protein [Chloroflexota bacterium]